MYMVPVYEVGDRVYCVDFGPEYVGTVTTVTSVWVYVEWDMDLSIQGLAPSQLHIVEE